MSLTGSGPTGQAFLYAAGHQSDAAARRYGGVSTTQSGEFDLARRRRAQQLAQLIQQGKIKSSQLGSNDRSLIAASDTVTPKFGGSDVGGHGILGGVGGFLGNLGSDIFTTGKYLLPGLYATGKAVAQDLGPALMLGLPGGGGTGKLPSVGTSHVRKEIIDPTITQYKNTYGPGGGSFFENFYQHPLGPILDAATVVSGGLGAAARAGGLAARTGRLGGAEGRIGQLQRFTSPEGRAPLVTDVGREIPREFTTRPLSRLGQQGLDVLGQRVDPVGRAQLRLEERRQAKTNLAESQRQRFDDLADPEITEFVKAAAKVKKPEEQQALTLLQLGINSPRYIATFEDMIREGVLKDPETVAQLTTQGIDVRYLEHMTNLPDKVKERVLDPSEAMIAAHRAWEPLSDRLAREAGISPEEHAAHIAKPQKILDRAMKKEESHLVPPEAPGNLEELTAQFIDSDRQARSEIPPDPTTYTGDPEGWAEIESDYRRQKSEYQQHEAEEMDRLQADGILNPGDPGVHVVQSRKGLDDNMGSTYNEHIFIYRDDAGYPHAAGFLHETSGGRPYFHTVVFQENVGQMPLPDATIREEIAKSAAKWYSDKWEPRFSKGTLPHEGFPISPTYVPLDPAAGFEPVRGFRVPEGAFERPQDRLFSRAVGFRGDPGTREKAQPATAFVGRDPKYLHESQFETLKAGAFRTDIKAYVDHLTQRAKIEADNYFKQGALSRMAMLDPETGEAIKVRDLSSRNDPRTKAALAIMAEKGLTTRDVTVVNDGFAVQFFRKQVDHMQEVRRVFDQFVKDLPDDADVGDLFKDEHLNEILGQITEADAKAFVTHHWNAAKAKGYIVPKAEAKYHAKIANLDLPQTNPVLRFLGTWMNRWRGAILTYMPRWWINTAAGSLIMNMIEGVNFHDYWLAGKMKKAGLMPQAVNLGHQPTVEYAETAERYGRDFMPSMPTREIQRAVQGIENYFRRGAYVHQLKRQGRIARNHDGREIDLEADAPQAMEDIGNELQNHYEMMFREKHGNVAEALDDPTVVRRALQEVDKFSYNYSILGPDERHYVRNFIPFWGWYKFISMAAYRLPVELPGRTNIMRLLSNIAAEQEASFGAIPDWVKGAIPISLGGGKYTYLGTQGLNPFSSFFDPLGGGDQVGGTNFGPGQFNPLIQAGLNAFGFDTLGGGGVRISPQSGVGTDFLGRLVDEKTGQPTNIAEHEAGWRFLHSLISSFAQYRLSPLAPQGGEFPESVPLIHQRPFPSSDPDQGPFPGQPYLVNLLAEYTGAAPKHYNLSSQTTAAKGALYVGRKNAKARAKLKRQK